MPLSLTYKFLKFEEDVAISRASSGVSAHSHTHTLSLSLILSLSFSLILSNSLSLSLSLSLFLSFFLSPLSLYLSLLCFFFFSLSISLLSLSLGNHGLRQTEGKFQEAIQFESSFVCDNPVKQQKLDPQTESTLATLFWVGGWGCGHPFPRVGEVPAMTGNLHNTSTEKKTSFLGVVGAWGFSPHPPAEALEATSSQLKWLSHRLSSFESSWVSASCQRGHFSKVGRRYCAITSSQKAAKDGIWNSWEIYYAIRWHNIFETSSLEYFMLSPGQGLATKEFPVTLPIRKSGSRGFSLVTPWRYIFGDCKSTAISWVCHLFGLDGIA